MRVLWIVQDGVLAGPGASQTLPYVRGLAARGLTTSLLSVEKPARLAEAGRVAEIRGILGREGVRWTALPYGGGPAGSRTAVQLARTYAAARGLVRRDRIDLVHARSYLPGLVASLLGRPFVFDMRGRWPLERVEAGLWREGSVAHRFGVAVERRLLARAAAVVVLARAGLADLPPLSVPVAVVPTAADLDVFRPGATAPPASAPLKGAEVYVLAGALGTWYRTEDALDFLAQAVRERPRAMILLLSGEDVRPALAGLHRRGVPEARILAAAAHPEEVPGWLAGAHAGLLFVRSTPAKRASVPTKLAEFLGCGVPVVTTPHIGDVDEWLEGPDGPTGAGAILRTHDEAARRAALAAIDEIHARRPEAPRSVALAHLGLPAALTALTHLYSLAAVRPRT